jgi:hypothetical protein
MSSQNTDLNQITLVVNANANANLNQISLLLSINVNTEQQNEAIAEHQLCDLNDRIIALESAFRDLLCQEENLENIEPEPFGFS